MCYDREAWERERSGWRAVVQLNIIRAIITILSVVETELNGEIPLSDTLSSEQDENPKFTDRHQLLMIRLAPLRGVETDLRRRLGAATEPGDANLPMSATPFDTPTLSSGPPVKRKKEFSVRSWMDVVDPGRRHSREHSSDVDPSTLTIANCKEDMKALVEDDAVKAALDRRKILLPDSAVLCVTTYS
jgi:guanine nucleotide-binding protein alpha-1 subunit